MADSLEGWESHENGVSKASGVVARFFGVSNWSGGGRCLEVGKVGSTSRENARTTSRSRGFFPFPLASDCTHTVSKESVDNEWSND